MLTLVGFMVIFMLVIYIYIYICVCVYHAYASMLGNMAYESDTVWVG